MVKDQDWFLTNKLPHIYIQYINTCIKLNDFKTLHKIMTLRSTSADLHEVFGAWSAKLLWYFKVDKKNPILLRLLKGEEYFKLF